MVKLLQKRALRGAAGRTSSIILAGGVRVAAALVLLAIGVMGAGFAYLRRKF